jgi:outer membrane protein TolC
MRWKKFVGGLALSLTAITGCKQPVFMTEPDYATLTQGLPKDLEENPKVGDVVAPDLTNKITAAPPTILDPERPPHYMSLAEAIARALENGTVGQPGNGQSNDTSAVFPLAQAPRGLGAGAIDRDSIRVLALDPANIYTDIEASLSKFDARWISSMNWNTTDRPVGTSLDQFQAQGQTNNIRTQAAELTSSLVKPLPTGGVAAITFDTQYQYTNLPARVNPSYTPSLQFQFEQPLLQGFGVDINQIRADHPGSILTGTQFATQPRNAQEGIVLTRIRFDQARAEFEANVASMLLNVEIAYWNLYAAYGQLYAREIALRKNLEIWRLTRDRVVAGVKGPGGVSVTAADEYEAQGQYESSRSDWLAALGGVLEAERNLRGLLGMQPEDGTRLVPSDQPTYAPVRPDWTTAVQEALVLMPELAVEREQVKATQLHLIDQKNRLLPDVRFTSTYNINAIGNRLDGPDPNSNALRGLASDRFNNWSVGLRADYTFGYRDANAGVRLARLQLAQAYYSLQTGEDKVKRYLTLQYRHVYEFQEQIQRNLAAMEAYNNELNVRILRIKAGTDTPDVTLQAVRFGSAAMVLYYQFLGQYNAALANFEYAKGTLLRRDNVIIADGPLPNCPQVRAVEHEEERVKALILREPAAPIPCGPEGCTNAAAAHLIRPEPLSLPEWMQTKPALPPEVNEAPPTPPARGMGNPSSGSMIRLPGAPPKTLDEIGPATLAPTPPAPAVPATMPTAAGSGTLRALNYPEDRPVPPTLPALPAPDLGTGSR